MPADYSSTAKALALPISPISSPSPDQQSLRPPWSRRISGTSRYSTQTPRQTYKSQFFQSATKVQRKIFKTFRSLTFLQKVLAVTAIIILNVFLILFLVYNEKIFGYLAPAAKKWHDIPGGWIILWVLIFVAAFPPLIGYSTILSISGFVYGFPNGWFIVSTATVAGSLASFIASRTVLSNYVHKLVGKDKRFEALALTLKHDGLKILCMIRVCPLPYSLSNAAMSTFPTVHPLSFALATAIASPKLLIHVFIGSRLALIAKNGGKKDAGTKAINYASIIIGSLIGAGVGWFIYQKTMARARQLEEEELENGLQDNGVVVGGRDRTYTDVDGAEDLDAAALMDPDDISLWDHEEEGIENRESGYRDESTDDEDVFARGDVDDDSAVGKRKQ
jgi:uncharacterized membrane protein YdjX (TVP38/TMEM64 family)